MENVETDNPLDLNDASDSESSSSSSDEILIEKEKQIECEKDLISHLDMLPPHNYGFGGEENCGSSSTRPKDQLNQISALDDDPVDVDCTLSLGNLAYDAYQYREIQQLVAEEKREIESNKKEEKADYQEVENVAAGQSVFGNFMQPAAANDTTAQQAFGQGEEIK